MKNVIELIKQKRKLLGWSLRDTAERFGLTTTGYAKIENGETSITLERLSQMADIFGMSVGELLGLEGAGKVGETAEVEALKKEVQDLKEKVSNLNEINMMLKKMMRASEMLLTQYLEDYMKQHHITSENITSKNVDNNLFMGVSILTETLNPSKITGKM